MSIEQRENFRGLYTNVAETKAPPGTLRIADNVVVRKPGALEQRQGFDYSAKYSEGEISVGQDWLNTINYGDEVIHETATRFWSKLRGYVVDWQAEFYSPAIPATRFRKDSFASVTSRGNLYIPMAEGVMRWPLAADRQMELSGLHSSRVGLSQAAYATATNNPLANGFQWAYRAVLRRTDENGLITRSRPTGAFTFKNTLGYAGACRLQVYTDITAMQSGDVVELYRGRQFANAITPDDEMALVKTFSRADFAGTTGVTYVDDLPDNMRGAALYTSPSQLGMVAASDCPPAAAFCETYRGCLFLGNVRGPARIVFSYSAAARNVTISGATGIGNRTISYSRTAGSATITGITPIVGVQVGQYVSDQGYIKTLTGTTATLVDFYGAPQLATSTGAVSNVQLTDAVWIKSPRRGNLGGAALWTFALYPDFALGSTFFPLPTGLFYVTPPEPTYGYTAVLESIPRLPFSLALGASHGSEMSPPIALPFSDGTPFEQDVLPYGLVWSEPDQPENFPSVNYALIGDRTKHILGLSATRDALFIFKEDGIWRLSGYGGQWSIDAFDLTTFCVLPSSIKKLNNRIFMLSNKGVVAIDDTNGVVVISTPIADQVKRLVDNARTNWARDGYYSLTGVPGVAATVDDRNSEYLLLAGTTPLDLGDGQVLVYNEVSDAWTTFSFSPVGTRGISPLGLSTTKTGDPCVLTRGDRRSPTYTRSLIDGEVTPELHDGVTLLGPFPDFTAPTPTTANVRFNQAYAADLGRDFARVNGSALFPIIGQPAQDIVTFDTTSAAWPGVNNVTYVYRGVRATVQPHGWVNGPANSKRWKSIIVAFSRFLGPSSLRVFFSGAEQLTVESVQSTTQDFTLARALGMARYHLGSLLRQVVPTAHKRSWLVRARLSWVAVFGTVSLEAIGLDSEQTATDRPQTDAA